MISIAVAALIVTIALAMLRTSIGPGVFDRIQGANTVGTSAMTLLAVMSFLNERPEFLDLALVYGFLNVIGTVAVLKFFRYGGFGEGGER